jgi:hypothetical protein
VSPSTGSASSKTVSPTVEVTTLFGHGFPATTWE